MNRVTSKLALGSLILASIAAPVLGESPDKIHVRGRVGVQGGVTETTTISIQLFRLTRDNFGNPTLGGRAENAFLTLDPGTAGGTATFDAELDVDAEYEVVVVPIRANGDMRSDGRDYFATQKMSGEYPSDTQVLHAGSVNQLDIPLKWIDAKDLKRSNILQVIPRKTRGDYLMTLAVNDPTNVKIM